MKMTVSCSPGDGKGTAGGPGSTADQNQKYFINPPPSVFKENHASERIRYILYRISYDKQNISNPIILA